MDNVVLITSVSDHLTPFIRLKKQKQDVSTSSPPYRILNDSKLKEVSIAISLSNFDHMADLDASESYNSLVNIIKLHLDNISPEIKPKNSKSNKQNIWMTKGI